MEKDSFIKVKNFLIETVGENNLILNDLMKNHTSFKIGGPADFIVMPNDVESIVKIIKWLKDNNIDYMVMGNGSNLLVRDKGIRGVVIKISENFRESKIENNRVVCQSGLLLSSLAKKVATKGLAGFEFASGIPGTIGGAVAMNAGAYGGEMKDVVTKIKCITEDGEICVLEKDQIDFEYRNSKVIKDNLIVVEVELTLKESSVEEIFAITNELTKKRRARQPLSSYSAGSTFKRPEGYFAGKLIEDCGLKGVAYGDAMVSSLHSGFIINKEAATCEEMCEFLNFIKKTVYDKFGVLLEEEVRIIGEV